MGNDYADILKSNWKLQERPGDYVEAGLLHCGNCHEPKQQRLKGQAKETFGEIVCRACKCDRDRNAEIERKIAADELAKRRREAVANGWIPEGYFLNRFERDREPDSKTSKALQKYTENFTDMWKKNIGILLYGEVGTGKTFYASCVASAVFDMGHKIFVDTYANMCQRIQDFGDERNFVLWCIRNVALVVMDDFGAERDTEYVQEKGFTLIDERVKAKAPLIITTNVIPGEANKLQQARIFSRLKEACSVQIEVTRGTRGREEIGRDKAEYFKKICGGEI